MNILRHGIPTNLKARSEAAFEAYKKRCIEKQIQIAASAICFPEMVKAPLITFDEKFLNRHEKLNIKVKKKKLKFNFKN